MSPSTQDNRFNFTWESINQKADNTWRTAIDEYRKGGSWIRSEDSNSADTDPPAFVQYGIPMHLTGNPKEASLFLCLLNPSIPDGMAHAETFEKVRDHDDLLIGLNESHGSSYKVWHEKQNIFELYQDIAKLDNSDNRAFNSCIYYLQKYLQHIVKDYQNISGTTFEYWRKKDGKNFTKNDFLKENEQKELGEVAHIEKLRGARICNVELVPYRSKESRYIKRYRKPNLLTDLSVAAMLRRVCDSIEDGSKPMPLIVMRSHKNWIEAFDHYLMTSPIQIRGNSINNSSQLLEELHSDQVFFCFNGQSASLSYNSICPLMPDKSKGAKLSLQAHRERFEKLAIFPAEKDNG